jgi:hypothetical protein
MKQGIAYLIKINSIFIAIEIVLLSLIYRELHEIRTGVIGSPLLFPNGSRPLEFALFTLCQMIVIPSWYTALKVHKSTTFILNTKIEILKNEISDNFSIFIQKFLMILLILMLFAQGLFRGMNTLLSNPFLYMFYIFTGFVFSVVVYLVFLNSSIRHSRFISTENVNFLRPITLASLFALFFYYKYSPYQTRLSGMILIVSLVMIIFYLTIHFIQKDSRNSSSIHLVDYTISLPILFFVLYSNFIGFVALNPFESFAFSNTSLLRKGLLPWRNFIAEHGLWEDLFRPFFGSLFVDNSNWGAQAGIEAIIRPLEYLIFGLVILFLSKKLSLTITLIGVNYLFELILDQSALGLTRMLPLFVVSLFLKANLRKPTGRNALGLALGMTISLLWSPEGIYPVFTVVGCLLIAIWHANQERKIYLLNFTVVFATTLFFTLIPLAASGLIKDWFFSNIANGDGYLLAWGMNIQFNLGLVFCFFFITVPLLTLIYLSVISAEIFQSPQKSKIDKLWLLPMAVTIYAYFIKFLNWPDWHLTQSTSIFLAALLFLVASNLSIKELKSITPIVILLLPLLGWQGLQTTASQANMIVNPVESKIVGPSHPLTNVYIRRVTEVKTHFSKIIPLNTKTTIFDFGNEPVTWFDVLDFKSAGGVDKVISMATPASQKRVIDNLIKNRPNAIIWGGEFGYWGLWNGTHMRQYLISSFILNNYVPVAHSGQYVMFLEKGVREVDPDALRQVNSIGCDWLNGASKFVSPEKMKRGPESNSSSNSLENSSFNPYLQLKMDEFTKGLIIESDRPAEIFLKQENGGEIKFKLDPNQKRTSIWLDQCPTFHNSNSKTKWIIQSNPADAKLKIYSAQGTSVSNRTYP